MFSIVFCCISESNCFFLVFFLFVAARTAGIESSDVCAGATRFDHNKNDVVCATFCCYCFVVRDWHTRRLFT